MTAQRRKTRQQMPALPTPRVRDQVRARPRYGRWLLDQVHDTLRRFVILPSEEAYDAVTLWVAASHGVPWLDTAPRLAIISPTKRCGKSRLIDVCECLSFNPLTTANTTVAALVRSISPVDPPTIFIDEADTVFGTKKQAENNEDLRGIVNSGHQRGRPVRRWDVRRNRAEELETFAFAALAAIKDLPDTIMDRAVVVRMRRRANDEKVERFRLSRNREELEALGAKVNRWLRSYSEELSKGVPEDAMPVEDRAADTWEPLIAVADLAGGKWPDRARAAARVMTGAEAGEAASGDAAGLELLQDLRTVWYPEEDKVHSNTIVNRLINIEGARWSNYQYGRPINQYELAQLIKPYGISPKSVRAGADKANRKGFERHAIEEVWRRYLPEEQPRSASVAPGQRRSATRKVRV
ncbi:hypothetical protein DLJ47_01885 [Micromonospora sp. S4605]|uniref:DUF3631 domain-containing protein n=1 Tax=Micromonospora sp. S4605 TaxID=1420897 RepID=UPI000D6F0A1B|nr:DUF3631 domain-containing protein [Micromonospora sp. S4605]PWU57683.1 hypothetical protein DLJ47_01885 [Micromonospora sp. S4605]